MQFRHWLILWRYLWVAPITLLCMPLVGLTVLTGGKCHLHTGVLEVCGGILGHWLARGLPFFGKVNAFTIGHMVVGVSPYHLDSSRAHERVHVTQFETWGILFPLVYLGASLHARLQGKHPYWDNRYECEARLKAAQSLKKYRKLCN